MSENVESMIEMMDRYSSDPQRINLMTYIMVKHGGRYYVRDINPTQNSYEIIEQLAQLYHRSLIECLTDSEILEWEQEQVSGCIFLKPFLAEETQYFENLNAYGTIDQRRFLTDLYKLRFFIIRIPINRNESIHLFQKIRSTIKTKDKAHVSLFADRNRIQFENHRTGFTIDTDFHFSCYYNRLDTGSCFSIVKTRKPYERLFGYIRRYREAYRTVSEYPYVDFSFIRTPSEDLARKCYSLLRFPNLQRCVNELANEIKSGTQTISKNVLERRGIPYNVNMYGIPIVHPQNVKQAKYVIRMLHDGIAKTHYCQTDILAKAYDTI